MNFNALEFKADFKNRIFYALNTMYQYHVIFISDFTHVAALSVIVIFNSYGQHFHIRVKMASNHNNA